jgi:hypothetical protein
MKKGFRNTLIIALFTVFVGALLTGCSGFHYVVNNSGANFLDKDDAMNFTVEKTIVEPITTLVIDTSVAEVEVIEADDFYVEIDYLYWDQAPEYTLEKGKLTFNDSNCFPNSYSINFNLHNTIKIYLPKGSVINDLYVKNSSGDVTLAGFIAKDLSVTVSYGDFSMMNAAATEADITLSSGRSKISDFAVGELNFTNSYGNAIFTNLNAGEDLLESDISYDSLDINMSSGNVTLTGLNFKSIELSNSYGDVTCDEVAAEDFDMELSSGNLEVSNADIQDIEVDNSYGNVTLKLDGQEEDYSLDLDTSYGKIKVADESYDEHIIIEKGGTREVSANLSSGDVRVSFSGK